jgi:hypothetical protein
LPTTRRLFRLAAVLAGRCCARAISFDHFAEGI